MFKICRANHNVRKATHAILDDAAQLKARVDRLCAQAAFVSNQRAGTPEGHATGPTPARRRARLGQHMCVGA